MLSVPLHAAPLTHQGHCFLLVCGEVPLGETLLVPCSNNRAFSISLLLLPPVRETERRSQVAILNIFSRSPGLGMASVTRPRRSRLLLMHSWWRFSSIYALVLVISCPGRRADPETVEGLYLTKKSAGPEVHELKGDLTAVPALPVGFRSASLERQQPPPHGSPSSATTRRPFPQARFGGVDKGAGRKAFGNYLSKPHRQRDHRYQPPPKPHYFPPIDYGMINQQMNQQKLSMKTMNNLHGNADFFAKAKHSWKWVSPSPSPKSDGKNPQPFTDVLGHPTTTGAPGSASSTATTMSVNPSKPPSPGVKNLNQLNDGQPPDLKHPPPSPSAVTSTSSSTSIANASSSEPIEANIDKKNHLPRVGFLRSPVVGAGAGGHVNSFTVEGSTGRQAVLGVILGVAFIAVFVGSGVALLAQCAADRGIFFGQRRMSGSNEEDARSFSSSSPPPSAADATPPELSLGGGHPTFVQPPAKGGGGGTAGGGGNRQVRSFAG